MNALLEHGALAALATIVVGLITYISARPNAAAATQAQLNTTAQFLITEIRKERDECNSQLAKQHLEIEKLKGELANAQQFSWSMANHLRRLGIDLPKFKSVETVFVLDSTQEENHGQD